MRIIQNPDTEYAAEVRKKLKENNGFCPCSLVKSKDTKCKCRSFREQIERGEPGACRCGLFIAEEE